MFIIKVLIMLANYPSSSMMERVYEQNAQQNVSVQRNISVVLPIPFVNMDPNNVTNVDGLASISHLTIHSTQMQERWFWLRGHVVLFPESSFGSEDFTACFRPWVLPVQLWLYICYQREHWRLYYRSHPL